jgi:hypothetical protein
LNEFPSHEVLRDYLSGYCSTFALTLLSFAPFACSLLLLLCSAFSVKPLRQYVLQHCRRVHVCYSVACAACVPFTLLYYMRLLLHFGTYPLHSTFGFEIALPACCLFAFSSYSLLLWESTPTCTSLDVFKISIIIHLV